MNLPACEVLALPGGLKVCAYRDVADWRAVLEVDAEVTRLRAQVATDAVQLHAAGDKAAALTQALEVREAGLAACAASLEGERSALIERDRELQVERARPRFGWGARLALAGGALGVGVLVGVLAR